MGQRRAPGAALLLTALLFLLLLHACAQDVGSACSFDSDCPTNQACVTEFCRPLCRNDTDCRDIELPDQGVQGPALCRPFTRTSVSEVPINVCAPKEEFPPVPVGDCTTDKECTMGGNLKARCSILNTCIVPPDVTSVLIRNQSDADAILLGVQLERSDMVFAEHVIEEYIPANTPVPQKAALPLQPTLSPLTCPAPTARTAPLGGLNGQLRLYFRQANGQRLVIQPGDRIVAFEQGSQCTDGQTDELLQAFLCVSQAGDRLQSTLQCTTKLGDPQPKRAAWIIP